MVLGYLPKRQAVLGVPHSVASPIVHDSRSRGGDVAVHVFDINQPSLPTLFFSFKFCSYVCFLSMALSTVFHSIKSPDSSAFSHSGLPVLFLP